MASPLDPSQWVDRHGDALYGYAMLQLGNAETAEECVQETLLAALVARDSFRGASVRAWLMGILRHKICDHWRRRRETSLSEIPEASKAVTAVFVASGKWKDNPGSWAGEPETVADRSEFWEALRGCLSGLPPLMRDVYCLRELHGLAAPGICEVLDVSPSYLWTLLHRSRLLLRQCLERNWFGQ